jgi:alpha-L-fucosidase
VIQHAPWFEEARLGMFIHWGLYALPARHEWVMNREELTAEDYARYFRRFDPDLYDPREWARAAKGAGMKYVVLTTKHHDGFCLWDSSLTDFKSTNTPAGRDLVRPCVDALRSEGLKVGFYHSLLDWHHPDFTIDGAHPQRNSPEVADLNAGRNLARYREYLHGQVRELLTDYGRIDYLFFDFSYGMDGPEEYWAARAGRSGTPRRCWPWSGNCSRASWSTTAWKSRATSLPLSSTSRRDPCWWITGRWRGKRARRSTEAGAMTGTT